MRVSVISVKIIQFILKNHSMFFCLKNFLGVKYWKLKKKN